MSANTSDYDRLYENGQQINTYPQINRQNTKNCTIRTSSRSSLQAIHLVIIRHTSESIRMDAFVSLNTKGGKDGIRDLCFQIGH